VNDFPDLSLLRTAGGAGKHASLLSSRFTLKIDLASDHHRQQPVLVSLLQRCAPTIGRDKKNLSSFPSNPFTSLLLEVSSTSLLSARDKWSSKETRRSEES
jgi:hypothetical protein